MTPKVGTESHQLLLRSLYAVLREPHMQLPRYSLLLLPLPPLLLPLLVLPPPLLLAVHAVAALRRAGLPNCFRAHFHSGSSSSRYPLAACSPLCRAERVSK